MPDLLFEIGTEELPPNLINDLTSQVKKNIVSELTENNIQIDTDKIKTYSTPRRIALIIENLPKIQEEKIIEIKGPDKTKAFSNGLPTQAAIGFAKKHNLDPKDLKIKEVNGSEYVFVSVKTGGKEVISLLSTILPNSLKKITGEKFMKWGSYEEKFSRPIRWLTTIFDSEIIPFSYAGVKSTNKSVPHRFNKENLITITTPKEYETLLEKNNTIASPLKREELILEQIKLRGKELNLEPLIDAALLNEVTNITESPNAIVCKFDNAFLELPECIIETVLRKHQKYFVLKDKNNKLTNNFVVITNGVGKEENIRKGNEKVVRARLNDAKFFYKEDLKRPFTYEERIKDLSKVTFQKGLGSMEEKVERVIKLSDYLYEQISQGKELVTRTGINCKKNDVIETGKLCKLDLVTHMVFEMPELQGLIGKEYAIKNNFSETISNGIQGHYNPSNTNSVGMIVGLADRIDNLVCLFSIGKIPTSSADPFALRVQTTWIFNVIEKLEDQFTTTIDIDNLINTHAKEIKTKEEVIQKIKDFLIERLKLRYEAMNTSATDHILAVMATRNSLKNMQDISKNISLLNKYFSAPKEEDKIFLQSAKRLIRIVNDDVEIKSDFKMLTLKEEVDLLNIINEIENKRFSTIDEYFNTLKILTTPINCFFDKVLVNDPNPDIKNTRQELLKKGKKLFEKICDFNQVIERN